MPVTINGTTGVVTPGATIGSINGILKSSSGVVSQAVAGQDYGQLTLATAQTASGTSVDFTSIPSYVKRITVMFNGVSTNSTSNIIVQIGAGSITSSGYASTNGTISSNTNFVANNQTSGFYIGNGDSAGNLASGILTIAYLGSNIWVASGTLKNSTDRAGYCAGDVTIIGTIDRLRVTTTGSNTFDAGTINISYE
jgi:hypothetical protein